MWKSLVRSLLVLCMLLTAELFLGPGASGNDPASDPVLQFSSFLGGTQSDSLAGISADAQGNLYVAGSTDSINLPTGSVFQKAKSGRRDVFVAKLNPNRSLAWITYLGGSLDDDAADIVADSSGNVVVVGTTRSTDFPLKNARQASLGGGSDIFVAKLNPSGTALVFSTFHGGSGDDAAQAVALAPGQEVLVAGTTRSSNFPVTESVFQGSLSGGVDAVVARYGADGKSLVFSSYYGGKGNETPYAVLEGPDQTTLICGSTTSSDLPLESPFQDVRKGSSDAFLAAIVAGGSALDFSTYYGGRAGEVGYAVALEGDGTLVLGGETTSSDLPMLDPIQRVYAGGTDMFVTRIAPDRTTLRSATYLGGSGLDSLRDLRLHADGRVFAAGLSNSTDFPVVGTAAARRGGLELVAAVMDLDRVTLDFASWIGGELNEIPGGMALNADGMLLMAGATNSLDFPAVAATQEEFGGTGLFLSRNGGASWQIAGRGLPDPNVTAIHIEPGDSAIYVGTLSRGIYRSGDGGGTWAGIGPANQEIRSIAVAPGNSQLIYAAAAGGLFRTADGGASWTRLGDGESLPLSDFTVVAVDPKNVQVVYAGTVSAGLYKTVDGGGQWTLKTGAPETTPAVVVSLVIDPVTTSNVFVGTNGAVYKSANGGDSWTKTGVASSLPIRGLAIDRGNPSRLYAPVFLSAGPVSGHYVARTEDGGVTWRTSQNTLPAPVTRLAVSPSNRNVLFASTQGAGISKSADGGVSWSESNQGLEVRDVLELAIDPANSSNIIVGHQSPSDGMMVGLRPGNRFYFPQVADGIVGRIKFQTALILVNSGPQTTVTVEFFDPAGTPMAIRFGEGVPESVLELDLPAGGAYSVESAADPGLRYGYARITAGTGVDGTAIFTRTDLEAKRTLFEAGVPATRAGGDFTFLLDSIGDQDTGIALVNAAEGLPGDAEPATIRMLLHDAGGALVSEAEVTLARGHHLARFIGELFPEVKGEASEMRGLITVQSPVPVAALTLRQRDRALQEFPEEVASLTPFPVMSPSNLGSVLYFPQIANGVFGFTQSDQFRTSFYVANPAAILSVTRFTLEFFTSQGQAMGLDLGDGKLTSRITADLLPGQFRFFETTGLGTPQVGYARISASSPIIGGTAVFSQRAVAQAVILFEAGVAATIPRRNFSLFLDSVGYRDTGLALVNAGSEPAQITLRLFDLDNNLVFQKTLEPLNPGHHLPRFVSQLLPEVAGEAGEMLGVVTVSSTQPLAAVTLRQKVEPGGFPATIPTLTTFPVIPGSGEE